MKFKLDENLGRRGSRVLSAAGHDVSRYVVLMVVLTSGSCGTSAAVRTNPTSSPTPFAGRQVNLTISATATSDNPRRPASSAPAGDALDGSLREQLWSTRPCYDAYAFRTDSPVSPLLVKISFLITPDGDVKIPSIVASWAADTEMQRCIVDVVSGWRFPKRNGEIDARITTSINFVSTSADGTRPLNPKDASRVVLRGAAALQECYEAALKSNAGLRGGSQRFMMAIRVRSDGRVERVEVRPALDGEMTRCFVGAVSAWMFPTFEGPTITIEQAVTLTPNLASPDHLK